MRKKLQKIQLLSERQADAWLNDTSPLPAMPTRPDTAFTEQACLEIAKYTAFFDDVPTAIRVNPCSILELPRSRWETFPFFFEGCIVGIAVVSDLAVPANEIVCEGGDETLTAIERIHPEKGQND